MRALLLQCETLRKRLAGELTRAREETQRSLPAPSQVPGPAGTTAPKLRRSARTGMEALSLAIRRAVSPWWGSTKVGWAWIRKAGAR